MIISDILSILIGFFSAEQILIEKIISLKFCDSLIEILKIYESKFEIRINVI